MSPIVVIYIISLSSGVWHQTCGTGCWPSIWAYMGASHWSQSGCRPAQCLRVRIYSIPCELISFCRFSASTRCPLERLPFSQTSCVHVPVWRVCIWLWSMSEFQWVCSSAAHICIWILCISGNISSTLRAKCRCFQTAWESKVEHAL